MQPATILLRWSLPRNAALHGHALDDHLVLNLWIAFALLTLAHILLFAGLLFGRRASSARHKLTLEYLPLLALTILFGWLAVRAQHLWSAQRYTGASPAAMQVEVTGMQFAWYFRYPGPDAHFAPVRPQLIAPGEGNPLGLESGSDDFVTSELVLPAGREVDLTLRAQDVVHGFSVPEMRLKQNAVPGMTNHIHFTPERPGAYAILCTQVCGAGHYRMAATLRVVTPEAFGVWLTAHEVKP